MKQVLRHLLDRLILLLDGIAILDWPCKKHSTDIAIIRLDAIGDFSVWLDSAKEYRRIYPSQRIVLITNAACIELARHLPYWDDIWPINMHRLTTDFRYRWSTMRQISQAHFALAIQPAYSRDLMQGDSALRATAARQRIGSVGDTSNTRAADKTMSDRWFTKLLAARQEPLMELLRNAEFISQLTGQPYSAQLPKLPILVVLPENLRVKGEYCILFPGAAWHGRQWDKSAFVSVGVNLNQRYGWQIVLCGASSDHALCKAISESAPITFMNLAGKTSLAELAELIRAARMLVANETSAVHIATAVGTPTVCITGGGHYGRFVPYPSHLPGIKPTLASCPMPCFNCNWVCNQPHDPSGPVPCIQAISVPLVLSMANMALSESGSPACTQTSL
ncbi:MAG: glycosyltransferase family 9 protein [Rhodoferax sp.]|jgi:ADP-heptose:LPS heptosyltransferase|uniref:glycosyltransferase family 9 protein n=1 Tax=Rhodoferax sp. TaxID=50421 RepID=UPI001B45B034|nr:glycosyltransferase family 9 protein [Rhodoferax sp.]MBP9147907.1 glycosyltransferase family 9 protein [Rhodoferax sp.]MBP9735512.1 glycosyltransferase family 9 protein [Rhodoferax sp.]